MFQFKKNNILYMFHWRETLTSDVFNLRVIIMIKMLQQILKWCNQFMSSHKNNVYIGWIKIIVSHHFVSNFYDIDCSSEIEFNEEDILQPSKEGHLQQEDLWVISFISEDNEVVDEQQKTTLQFPTNVQQKFFFATSPWKHNDCIEEKCF